MPSAFSPVRPRRVLVRKIVAWTIWLMLVASVVTVMWALWYVSHRGFSRKWRQTVIDELAKRGVHMTVQRLTLNPLQGLVAKDVRLRDSRGGRAMATINEVVLDINYSNLVHREPFLNAVDLRNATLSLPLNADAPANSRPLEISRINARILLPPHYLTVERAEALVRGLRVSASGHFVNPEKFQWQASSGKSDANPLERLRQVLETVDDLKLDGGKPSLELRFSGDLAKPSSLFIEGVLKSGPFTIDNESRIESARLTATLADGRVRIDQCEIADRNGTLDATGAYQLSTGEADLQLRSTLDLPSLIHAVRPETAINELVLYQPPLLELNLSAAFPPEGQPRMALFGRLSTGRFAARSLIFEGAEADFSWESPGFTGDRARWYLHGARIRHKDGNFTLNAMQSPGDFRFDLDSRINPAVFLPLLPGEAREKLAEWEFRTPPVLRLEGRGPACSAAAVEITGQAQLGATKARGVPLKSASLEIGFKSNVLTCRNVKLERAEGIGTGTVVYDFNTDELQFQNLRTTLNPVDVVRIFDQGIADNLVPYRFKVRPALVANGTVGCARNSWHRNRLRVEVDGAKGMDYTFLRRELSASKITGVVSIIGDRLKLDNLDAALFGGRLRGKADISLRKAAGDYTAELATENVDFPSLTKLYFDYDTSQGKLNGSFAFSGLHDWARAIDGKGAIHVSEGNVFAIPIFGPFSGILNEVLPGTGYNAARKGTCTFEMRDGVVNTQDLVIEGRGFSIFGKGKLFILEDRMDFTARLNAQGLPGKLLDPFSHLLEYVSDGSLAKPAWRPRRLPKMMFPSNPPNPRPSASPEESPAPGASPSPGISPVPTPSVTPVPVGAKASPVPGRPANRPAATPRSGR